MDSLKSLFDDRKYELIIKLTKGSKNINDLFYRIASFICLGQYEDALYVIQDNQEILIEDLKRLVPIHIQLLCTMNRFEQAYAVLDYYINLPYQSQEVEEILKSIPDYIEKEKNVSNGVFYSDDDIIDKLLSKNNEDVMFAIDLLKKRDVLSFLPYLKDILTSYPNQTIRSLALILLTEKEVDRELDFLSEGKLIRVNPKKLISPFRNKNFRTIASRIDSELHDPSLQSSAVQVLVSYLTYTFPHHIEDEWLEVIYLSIVIYSKKLYAIEDIDVIKECQNKNLNPNDVNFYINKIAMIMKDI